MFTGIIRHLGTVQQATPKQDGLMLAVQAPNLFHKSHPGDSIAINGVCLTVVSQSDNQAIFELGPETLRKTTFAHIRTGSMVNIEFPMRIGDTFDGHFVQGHVDGTATINSLRPDGETTWMTIELPDNLASLTVHKGSISVDGVSLTVAEKQNNKISIMLLPYTVQNTAFSQAKQGDSVNIETDMLARHVAELMKNLP